MEETIWYLAEREHQINESPIKTSPEEKLDCRRLINHLREMSWVQTNRQCHWKETAFECERKRPCTPQASRQDQSVEPAHKQRRWPWPDPGTQSRAHIHAAHRSVSMSEEKSLLQSMGPKIWQWQPGGCAERGPRVSFGFHSKHTKKTLHKRLHSATAWKLPTADNTSTVWDGPYIKHCQHASTLVQIPWAFYKPIKAGQSMQGRSPTSHLHTNTPSNAFCHIQR